MPSFRKDLHSYKQGEQRAKQIASSYVRDLIELVDSLKYECDQNEFKSRSDLTKDEAPSEIAPQEEWDHFDTAIEQTLSKIESFTKNVKSDLVTLLQAIKKI